MKNMSFIRILCCVITMLLSFAVSCHAEDVEENLNPTYSWGSDLDEISWDADTHTLKLGKEGEARVFHTGMTHGSCYYFRNSCGTNLTDMKIIIRGHVTIIFDDHNHVFDDETMWTEYYELRHMEVALGYSAGICCYGNVTIEGDDAENSSLTIKLLEGGYDHVFSYDNTTVDFPLYDYYECAFLKAYNGDLVVKDLDVSFDFPKGKTKSSVPLFVGNHIIFDNVNMEYTPIKRFSYDDDGAITSTYYTKLWYQNYDPWFKNCYPDKKLNKNCWASNFEEGFTIQRGGPYYGITVGGYDVNIANEDDILHDGGSMRYTRSSNHLLLNNAKFSCTDVNGIDVQQTDSADYPQFSISIAGNDTITLKRSDTETSTDDIACLNIMPNSNYALIDGQGTLTLDATSAKSACVRNNGVLILNGGSITATTTGDHAFVGVKTVADGMTPYPYLWMNGAYVQASAAMSAFSNYTGDAFFAGIAINQGTITAPENAAYSSTWGTIVQGDDKNIYCPTVKIEPASYNVYVHGQQLTPSYLTYTSYMGGTATYNPWTRKLTLNKFTSPSTASADGYGIRIEEPCTIELEGENTLKGELAGLLVKDAAVTITGEGSGASLSATGTDEEKGVGILVRQGDLTIDNVGDAVAASGQIGGISGYLNPADNGTSTLTVNNTYVTAATSSDEYACIDVFKDITLDRTYATDPAGAKFSSTLYGMAKDGALVTESMTLSPYYNLFIGGTAVTDDNCADILGDGRATYDADSNTLTLNKASISTGDTTGIQIDGDMNIQLNGKNSITTGSAVGLGVTGAYEVNITGDGPSQDGLDITSAGRIGISCNATNVPTINISDCYVNSKAPGYALAGGNYNLSSANMKLEATSASVSANSAYRVTSFNMTDCSVLSPEGASYSSDHKSFVASDGTTKCNTITIGCIEVGDVNEDGSINITDVVKVLEIMSGNQSGGGDEPSGGDTDSHEYVNLGLSVKWATCNIGADNSYDYGDYLAWSSTDPVTASWGSNWRMPTSDELKELMNNCTWTWYDSGNDEFNGVAGYKVSSKTIRYAGNYIFLPAAGNYSPDAYLVGTEGYYFSSTLDGIYVKGLLMWNSNKTIGSVSRTDKMSIRPVRVK